MGTYADDTVVRVHPFAHRPDGEMVTIGDLHRQVFVSIPPEGLVILECLIAGQTVAQARGQYQATFGDDPDIQDFLAALEAAGLVEPVTTTGTAASGSDLSGRAAPTGSLGWIDPPRARRVCRPPVLIGAIAVVVAAVVLVAADPAVVPGPRVLVFTHDLAAVTLGLFAFSLAGVAAHEVAHLVAARAAGVPARITLSHRLWILVAETDMTGIWLASKRARYAAFLAGPLVDAVSGSVFVALLYFQRQGWIRLSPFEAQLAGACLWVYLLRLFWQCFVFVRTDFYFVAATAFNCKNLLADTQDYLNNHLAKFIAARAWVDQSSVPAAEMRVVRWYSLVWLAGRAAALATLFFVTLPVMGAYVATMAPMLVGRRSRYSVADAAVFAAVTFGVIGAGLVLWARSMFRQLIARRSHARSTT